MISTYKQEAPLKCSACDYELDSIESYMEDKNGNTMHLGCSMQNDEDLKFKANMRACVEKMKSIIEK